MIRKCVVSSLFILLLAGCGARNQYTTDIDTTNLNALENVRVNPIRSSDSKSNLSQLRIRSLKDSAMSMGARSGLAWASAEINQNMEKDQKYLDSIFNFNGLMLAHGVLPPVLVSNHGSLNLANPDTIRIADRTYQIIQQARFTTTPPNWRDYLTLNYAKPELPDKTLLPKSDLEQKIWKEGIREGWKNGIEQAYSIFQQNLARLKRDYNGMLLYRKLLEAKMIDSPYVARTELGVTGDGKNMRINDQVLRIVRHPKLKTNTKRWKAIVRKGRQ